MNIIKRILDCFKIYLELVKLKRYEKETQSSSKFQQISLISINNWYKIDMSICKLIYLSTRNHFGVVKDSYNMIEM